MERLRCLRRAGRRCRIDGLRAGLRGRLRGRLPLDARLRLVARAVHGDACVPGATVHRLSAGNLRLLPGKTRGDTAAVGYQLARVTAGVGVLAADYLLAVRRDHARAHGAGHDTAVVRVLVRLGRSALLLYGVEIRLGIGADLGDRQLATRHSTRAGARTQGGG